MRWTLLRDFCTVFGPKQRWRLARLALLVVFAGAVEFVAVIMLPAFVFALSQPSVAAAFLKASLISTWVAAQSETSTLSMLGGTIIAIFIARTLVLIASNRYQSRVVADLTHAVSRRLFSDYLHASYTHHITRNSAQCIDAIVYDARHAVRGIIPSLMALLLNAFLFLALIPVLLAIDPILAVAIGGACAAACYVFMLAGRTYLTRYFEQIAESRLALQIAVGEGVGALKHIRLCGLEAQMEREFSHHAERLARAEASSEFVRDLPRPLFELFAGSMLILATLVLLRTYTHSMILPVLALAGAVTIRMLPIANALTGHLNVIRSNIVSLTGVARELRLLEPETRGPHAPLARLSGDIVFRNVEYGFPGQQSSVLRKFDLLIPNGQTVAFVGPTGSGKSTAIDVMLGFLIPSRGEVTVGGRLISENLASWHRQVGYVPQAIFLLDASVLRNVALGVPAADVDEQAVWRALEQAQLAEFVAELPEGLNTHVGERGVRLSGGQRQRLGIARALYHDPAVLVLDEATAALDNATEQKLMAALQQRSHVRTTIMVAHRLNSVRNCDCIFLVKSGHVVTAGTYQELVATSVDFQNLAIEVPV